MHETAKKLTQEIKETMLEWLKSEEAKSFVEQTKAATDSGSFEVVISTADIDRQGETIDQNGWDLSHYKQNPVVLWGHDYYSLPIGITEDIYLQDGKLIAKGRFAPAEANPFAQQVRKLYDLKIVRATSVGFIAREMEGNRITKSELLEFSFVPVPANPYALTLDKIKELGLDPELLKAKGLELKAKDEQKEPENGDEGEKEPETPESDEQNGENSPQDKPDEAKKGQDDPEHQDEEEKPAEGNSEGNSEPDEGEKSADQPENKAVVSYEATSKAPEDRSWDGDRARQSLRKWASSDGSGDKDTIDWKKYRKGFAWYDGGDEESFGAYKLPHHEVIDGELKVVWNGVKAAMGALMGARGGTDIPDNEWDGVYNHLAKHYAQFDKEPPEKKDKGAVSDMVQEIENDPFERKWKLVEPVLNIFDAFLYTYLDDETPVEAFNDMLAEAIQLLRAKVDENGGSVEAKALKAALEDTERKRILVTKKDVQMIGAELSSMQANVDDIITQSAKRIIEIAQTYGEEQDGQFGKELTDMQKEQIRETVKAYIDLTKHAAVGDEPTEGGAGEETPDESEESQKERSNSAGEAVIRELDEFLMARKLLRSVTTAATNALEEMNRKLRERKNRSDKK